MARRAGNPYTDDIAQDLPEPGEYVERPGPDGSMCRIDSDGICHTHDVACWFCNDEGSRSRLMGRD